MGFYSLDALGRDAQRNGVEILLPDVTASDVWCTIERETGGVRVGLGFIRDWSEETATAVVIEREQRGRYVSIGDFVRRAPPKLKRTAIEHLVWVGGCDGFGLTRRELLWQGGLWLPPGAEDRRWGCGFLRKRSTAWTRAAGGSSSWRSITPTRDFDSAASRRPSGCSQSMTSWGSRRTALPPPRSPRAAHPARA